VDIGDCGQQRARLEAKAQEQINEALEAMKDDLAKANKEAAKQVEEMNSKKDSTPKEEIEEATKKINEVKKIKNEIPQIEKRPLIYFSYPMLGYTEQPPWVDMLRPYLASAGYLTYNPFDKINAQYNQEDIPALNALPIKVVKSLCSVLCIPEEVLLPFEAVWKLMQSGDDNDNYGIVFQCLWLLVRSSLVICDVTKPVIGAGTSQELLYAKQLGIPTIGLFPLSGKISPFAHKNLTLLFSGTDLIQLLPAIRGYAPK